MLTIGDTNVYCTVFFKSTIMRCRASRFTRLARASVVLFVLFTLMSLGFYSFSGTPGLYWMCWRADSFAFLDFPIVRDPRVSVAMIIMALLATLPVVWLVRYSLYLPGELRRSHRRQRGLCERCGYNVLASPDRCPECGTPHDYLREATDQGETKRGRT